MLDSIGINPHLNALMYVGVSRPQSLLKCPDLYWSQWASDPNKMPFMLDSVGFHPHKKALIDIGVIRTQSRLKIP